MLRVTALSAIVSALLISAAAWSSPSAHAASYRYWSYWLGSEAGWSYSSWGPASVRPTDGSVEGWRFGVGVGTNGAGLMPRNAPDFDQVCVDTPAQPNSKRVAIIIDPGVIDHAPDGESPRGAWAMCVTAPPAATGFDILKAAASVRTQSGMVCGLAGYPARECAVIVDDPRTPAVAPPTNTPSTPSTPRPQRQPRPDRQPEATPADPTSQQRPDAGSPAQADSSTDNELAIDEESVPNDSDGLSTERTGDHEGKESDDGLGGSANSSQVEANPADNAVGSSTPSTLTGNTMAASGTQVEIVAAAVTDPATGPGPTAAIVGLATISVLAAIAYVRRPHRTRSSSARL